MAENNKYSYYWYKENVESYQKLYKQDFDLKNKYLLFGSGGAIALIIQLLDKFDLIIRIALLIEISFLIILGFLTLYSLLKEVEVYRKYIDNYDEIYKKYGEEIITDENRLEVEKILVNNKFQDEAIKNERGIKIFFKIVIYYTIVLCIVIIGFEILKLARIGDNLKMNKNIVEKNIKLEEAIKPLAIEKPKLIEKDTNKKEEKPIKN